MILMAGRSAAELIRAAAKQLQAAGCQSPRSDAEWLLGHLLGQKPAELYLREEPVLEAAIETYAEWVDKRCRGIPLQYLLGSAEFFGAVFSVRPGVFIPRPETETVVEAALVQLKALETRLGRPLHLVDACTGSGCIAVTVARHIPTCRMTAIEVSCNAISVALENIKNQGLSSRVQALCGRWLEPLRSGGFFDAVISNPPYIPSFQVDQLPIEVRQEPRISLDGGSDGLRDVRRILEDAPRVLRPGGLVILECGEDQVEPLIAESSAWTWVAGIDRITDLSGRLRGCVITRD